MRAVRVESGWFKDTVVFKADEFEECYMGTFAGTRKYWVDEGEKVRLKVPKNWCIEVDEEYYLEDLVLLCGGLSEKFSWRWN